MASPWLEELPSQKKKKKLHNNVKRTCAGPGAFRSAVPFQGNGFERLICLRDVVCIDRLQRCRHLERGMYGLGAGSGGGGLRGAAGVEVGISFIQEGRVGVVGGHGEGGGGGE